MILRKLICVWKSASCECGDKSVDCFTFSGYQIFLMKSRRIQLEEKDCEGNVRRTCWFEYCLIGKSSLEHSQHFQTTKPQPPLLSAVPVITTRHPNVPSSDYTFYPTHLARFFSYRSWPHWNWILAFFSFHRSLTDFIFSSEAPWGRKNPFSASNCYLISFGIYLSALLSLVFVTCL